MLASGIIFTLCFGERERSPVEGNDKVSREEDMLFFFFFKYILQKKCRQIWCFQAANICRGCLAQPGEFYMRRDDEKAGGHSVTI